MRLPFLGGDCYNDLMSTDTRLDFEAILRDAVEGKTIEPAAARLIRERSEQLTAELRRVHGMIDDATFESLLEDE